MRAFLVQLSGLCVFVAGGFLWSVEAGVMAAGAAVVYVGLALEGNG